MPRYVLRETFKSRLRYRFTKAMNFFGFGSPDNAVSWFNGGATQADRRKYAAAIGDPLSTPLVMAAVKWLGRTISEPPLFVVKRDETGKRQSRTTKHPVVNMIRRPNEYYNGVNMMKGVAASWDLSGNAFLLKARDDSTLEVKELWYEPHYTIRPRWYNDNQMSRNPVFNDGKFISFYEIWRGGNWTRVEVDDVIHFKDGCDPRNPRLGINGLASILAEIFTDLQRAHFSATVLSNIGMVPFVVSPRESNQTITRKQANVLKEELELRSRGEKGKPIVAGRAVRIDELGFSPADMDLSAMASIPQEMVASVIGPNQEVLGWANEGKVFSNFIEARRDAYESFLMPLHAYMADQLTFDLLWEFETDETYRLEYDYSEVPALAEYRAKIMEMWGRAYRDGIAKRKNALIGTGQDFDDKDDDIYITDIIAETDLSNPENPGPDPNFGNSRKNPLPAPVDTSTGNERTSPKQNRGPVLGGKGSGDRKG